MDIQLVLEGTDMIGKTTVRNILRGSLPTQISDRLPDFSKCIGLDEVHADLPQVVQSSQSTKLFIVLYTHNNEDLEKRLEDRKSRNPLKVSVYDEDAVRYNIVYKKALLMLQSEPNVVGICVDGKTPFEVAAEVLHVYLHRSLIAVPGPTLEGESKMYRQIPDTNLALVTLKPTLYSFTHNRYGEVPGTDALRMKFWHLFASEVNSRFSLKQVHEHTDSYTLPSSYFTTLSIDGIDYAVVRFWQKISPLEVVWKNYLVGTMKHNLKDVDKRQTRYGGSIEYEGQFPSSIIRFDWRNDLPNKDECIPDEFAEFYIETNNAKKTARYVTEVIQNVLAQGDYELVDLCYFMTYDGKQVCGEISPDGMRIRKRGASYDKDLWRTGKDKTELCNTWSILLDDLTEK